MRSMGLPAGFRQILPLLAAVSLVSGNLSQAEDKFPNELASPIDEPQVVIPEQHKGIPVRPASRAIQESTDPLVKLVYETREAQRRRLLSTTEHTPWQIMHGLVGLRQELLLKHNGETVNGLEWIAAGQMYKNEPWFNKTPHGGQAHPFNNPYWFEGHINQFVAIISMCGVPLDAEFGTPQGPVTMRELLENAKMTVNEQEEVTWTLWALSRYLPSDAEWTNAKGEKWSIERLVKIEVGKTVGGPTSPCGGAHGLFALAHARNVYLRTGKPLRGVWMEAELKIQKYVQTARQQQNTNGTLSSSFFKGRDYKQDFDKRMASCGHLIEFLMMALPQDKLSEPWVRRAIESTSNDLMANRKAYVSCSPLYHATNGLSIYLDRVAPLTPAEVAQKAPNTLSISRSKDVGKEAMKVADATKPGVVTDGTSANQPPKLVPEIPEPPTEAPAVAPAVTEPVEPAPTLSMPTPLSPTPTGDSPELPFTPEILPLTIPLVVPSNPPAESPPAETQPSTPAVEPEGPPETPAPAVGENSSAPLTLLPLQDSTSATSSTSALGSHSVSVTVVRPATTISPSASNDAASSDSASGSVTVPQEPAAQESSEKNGDKPPTEKKEPVVWKATPPDRRKAIVVVDDSTPK